MKGTSGDGAPYPVSGGHARHSAERRQQARSIWASRGTLPDATDAGELRQGSVSREQGRFRGEACSSLGVSGAWTRGPLTAVAVSASRHPLPKPPQFSKQGEKQHRHGHARRDRTEPPRSVTQICLQPRLPGAACRRRVLDAAAGPPDHRPEDDDRGACDLSDACLATGGMASRGHWSPLTVLCVTPPCDK